FGPRLPGWAAADRRAALPELRVAVVHADGCVTTGCLAARRTRGRARPGSLRRSRTQEGSMMIGSRCRETARLRWLLLVAAAAGPASEVSARKHLSVEELMNVEVTSVSRSRQTLASAAAAITVVTAEDIRRSGATNIPEALRTVPGINVAQRDSSQWAVSSR